MREIDDALERKPRYLIGADCCGRNGGPGGGGDSHRPQKRSTRSLVGQLNRASG
jgi:hypothetical protein